MELKAGYKQTEVGLIPDNWDVKTIGDLVAFSGGSQPPKSTFLYKPKVGYVRLLQIRDYKSDEFETYIPEVLARKNCSEDEIMIGRYGPPIFQILRGLEGAYNVALMKAVPTSQLDRNYLYYFLNQEALLDFVESLSQRSSGQTGVEMDALKNYPFPLPPLSEQQVIAEALSDVDALLAALDALIVKKRNIKQGAMQELLTGHKRLSGFTGEWEVKNLGELTESTAGGTPSTTKDEYWDGNIRWMSSGELKLKTVFDVTGRITELGLQNSSTKIVPAKCVLVGLAGQGRTRGTVAMNMVELCTNQSIAAIYPSNFFLSEYLYYNLDSRYDELRSLSTGEGGRGGLNLTIIKNLSIPLPALSEQRAIAKILSDMDAELEALERQRDKTRALKQGMMQELLTGRKRLL